MTKFPEPDADRIRSLAPIVQVAPAGVLLWRVYFRGGAHPATWDAFRHWGPVRAARFDHHVPPPRLQDRAISYVATRPHTAIAETFQHGRTIDRHRGQPWLVAFRLTLALDLLDLGSTWSTAAGASMAIASGPRPRAQRWSRTIYEVYSGLHGLWYPSSMYANQPALALYERARGAVPATPELDRPLADPGLLPALRRLATEIGYHLV